MNIAIPEGIRNMAMEDRKEVTSVEIYALEELQKEFEEENIWHKFNFMILTGLLPKKDFPKYCHLPLFLFEDEGESRVLRCFNAKKLWEHFLPAEKLLETVSYFIGHLALGIEEFSFSKGYGFIDNLWTTLTSKCEEEGNLYPYMDSPAWTSKDKIMVADWLNFATFYPKGYEDGSILRLFMERDGFFEGAVFKNLYIDHDTYKYHMNLALEEDRGATFDMLALRVT